MRLDVDVGFSTCRRTSIEITSSTSCLEFTKTRCSSAILMRPGTTPRSHKLVYFLHRAYSSMAAFKWRTREVGNA